MLHSMVHKSGLTVLLQPQASHGISAVQLWVAVGSAHDRPWHGCAHFVEHLLFKGSRKFSSAVINHQLEALGGNINAFTSLDHSAYHLTIPAAHTVFGVELLLDMVLHPRFQRSAFEIERDVILQELQEGDDSAEVIMGQMLLKQSFANHPYQHPVIGYTHSIKKISVATLRNWHQQHYTPNQMVLTVVGEFDATVILRQLDKLLPSAAPSSANITLPSLPPRPKGSLSWLKRGEQQHAFELAYPTPGLQHEDIAALDLLNQYLVGDDFSPLIREFCQHQRSLRALDGHGFFAKAAGLFTLRALVAEGSTFRQLQQVLQRLEAILKKPLATDGLALAKLSLEKDYFSEIETAEGLAHHLSFYQTMTGQPHWYRTYLQRLQQLNSHDLLQTAQRYLKRPQLHAIGLSPRRSKILATSRMRQQLLSTSKTNATVLRLQQRATPPKLHRLQPGFECIESVRPSGELSSLYLIMHGGRLLETPALSGAGNLLAAWLGCSTQRYTEKQLVEQLAKLQASLDIHCHRNYFGWQLDLPSQHLQAGIQLLGELVHRPGWQVSTLKRERDFTLQELTAQQDHFEQRCHLQLQQLLYGKHPYGRNPLGDTTTLRQLKATTLKRHYQQQLQYPWSLAVVSQLSASHWLPWVRQALHHPKSLRTLCPPVSAAQHNQHQQHYGKSQQAYLAMGFALPGIRANLWPLYDMVGALLTAPGSGSLYLQLRERLGLVYSVQASAWCGVDHGTLMISTTSKPQHQKTLLEQLHNILSKLPKQLRAQDIAHAKTYLISNYANDLQQLNSQAGALVSLRPAGLLMDLAHYQKAISATSLHAVVDLLKRYIRPEQACSAWLLPK